MKKRIPCYVGILCCHAQAIAQSYNVQLNNRVANMPIYLWSEGNLAPALNTYVDIIASAPSGGGASPVESVADVKIVFQLNEPGFFDAGLGLVGGFNMGDPVQFQVRAWRGFEGRQLVYDGASIRGTSEPWLQKAGDPVLHIPSATVLNYVPPIPEHFTLTYGVIGAAALLTNGLMKTLKQKPPTSTNATPTTVTLVSTNAPAAARAK